MLPLYFVTKINPAPKWRFRKKQKGRSVKKKKKKKKKPILCREIMYGNDLVDQLYIPRTVSR